MPDRGVKSACFTMDEKLIELVRGKPELYDMRCQNYSDTVHKTQVWDEIGKVLSKTGTECKDRWLSIRSQHRKVMRKKNRNGSAANRKWRYEDAMAFILDCMRNKSRLSYLPYDEDEDSAKNEETSAEGRNETDNTAELDSALGLEDETGPTKTSRSKKPSEIAAITLKKSKMGKNGAYRRIEWDEHPIDVFLRSMATTVKTFSRYDQHLVKNQIFSIVSNMEAKYLSPSSPPPTE
ncbi:uncharacterized protein LOC143424680 [Xylocopa sonorina]|uniref:uncharacterized protein LOC143424680 n=1 Tax=Xylocopa sonorina TaxID=1818115 RepID=UPI00403AE7B8